MLDTAKVLEFFDATQVDTEVHVVGCGAVGSHICELLARMNFQEVHIYDFDRVAPHNLTNQLFLHSQIGSLKVDACKENMLAINPDMKVHTHEEGLQEPYILSGIIFMCADQMKVRQAIVEANKSNPDCEVLLDFRMRLTDAQHYFATIFSLQEVENLERSMMFTQEEAQAATPKSACGYELSVIYTLKLITALGMSNLINYLQDKEYHQLVLADTATMQVQAV